jgi:ABC-type Fe3+ transport system permease subunit
VYDALFWLYLINSILLINHEIDSAYWKEWELFKIPGGITIFLILHFPILFLILYGLILVFTKTFGGLVISLILGGGGIFALLIHTYFIKKGHDEFRKPISIFILVSMGVVSIAQVLLSIFLMQA